MDISNNGKLIYTKKLLKCLGFTLEDGRSELIYTKCYNNDYKICVELNEENINASKINYGDEIIVDRSTTETLHQNETFVVLECVDRLLMTGYSPSQIVLEKAYSSGHKEKGQFLDILVTKDGLSFYMIECKTYGREFEVELENLEKNGGQLFTYFTNDRNCNVLCLYSSQFEDNKIITEYKMIDSSILEGGNKTEIFSSWKKNYVTDKIFKSLYDEKSVTGLKINDLKDVSPSMSLYNKFAKILRKNAVSDLTNAYNKLFNLILCKIVDEDNNINSNQELDFQWKNNDTPYSVLDRLSNLYKTGINTYLQIQVLDYSNDDFMKEIESIFDEKEKKDNLKRKFLELRFIKNNEFAFIEVFNKGTFEQNALILKEVIKLFQKVRIKYSDKQQFLGEFFELLLNIGIKQAEGQFFTPIPIANFIVNSLPVKEMIEEKINKGQEDFLPYMIDFACGAGHFLTEFMHRVDPLLSGFKNNKFTTMQRNNYNKYTSSKYAWAEYFVYGIEKDYRLTKTSKVACFLNGDGSANIITGDGIANFDSKDYQNTILYQQTDKEEYSKDCEKFDILIANPPYSVQNFKDLFIENENSDGNRIFDLFSFLGKNSDDIECLFVERMKQLVKPKGYAGIILPVSLLTNEGIHQEARKLIIENFKIKAIVELGSGAFMVTGTKTCVLFLEKREKEEIEKIDTYLNKFKAELNDFTYKETPRIITQFLEDTYENITFEDYITLFKNPNDAIKECDLYQEFYENEYKEAEKEYDSLLKKKKKELNKRENAKIINTVLIDKIKAEVFDIEQKGIIVDYTKLLDVELDKIRCYLLNYKIETVIVKASNEQDEVKAFLGYEFSKRKGNEGLKEISPALEEELNTYTSRKNIHSKLYNPNDINDNTKVSYYVYKNFTNSLSADDKELIKELVADNAFITCTNNLFNFEDNSYSKGKINAYNYKIDVNKKKIKIESKWSVIKLGKIQDLVFEKGESITKQQTKKGLIPVVAGGTDYAYLHNKANREANVITISASGAAGFVNYWNKPIWASDCLTIKSKNENSIKIYYLYQILNTMQDIVYSLQKGNAQPHVYIDDVKKLKIPFPPLYIQQKIVTEIEEVETQNFKFEQKIIKLKDKIKDISITNAEKQKLNDFTILLKRGKSPKYSEQQEDVIILKSGQIRGLKDFDLTKTYYANSSMTIDERLLQKNDLLINSTGVGTAGRVNIFVLEGKYLVDSHVTILRLDNTKLLPLYALYQLYYNIGFKNIEAMATGQSGQIELSLETIANIKIPVPPLSEQQKIVAQIEELEKQIAEAQAVIDALKLRKQEILDKVVKIVFID